MTPHASPHAALSGLVGAVTLTLLHETTRQIVPDAPRLDVLGMRSIERLLEAAGVAPPAPDHLRESALAGDLVSNAGYFSLVALVAPRHGVQAGLALGAVAGVASVFLPGPLGLGEQPTRRTPLTQALTVGLYAAAGFAAGLAYRTLEARAE